MKKFFDSPWFYRVLALILAILMFIYVNNNNLFSTHNTASTSQTATRTEAITVPLQISANTERYYITGYPEKVNMTLEGPSALVTSTINTQNFRAYIDLSGMTLGTHEVPVKISGLNNQISYTVRPKRVKVKISDRQSKTLPIQIKYNKDAIAEGREVGTAKADPDVVTVTGPKSEVSQIEMIIAQVSVPKETTATIEREVMLQAVDSDGRQLNVVLSPATTHVTIPISLPTKTVSLKFNQKNGNENYVYTLSSETNKVKLFGPKNILKSISDYGVNVNLSGIKTDTTKRLQLTKPDGVTGIDPDHIEVTIHVKENAAN